MPNPSTQVDGITKWNNPLPHWLNNALVGLIVLLLLAGVLPFLMGRSEFRAEAYAPCGALFVAWIAIQMAIAIFTKGDLSTIIAVVLILAGIALFIFAILKPAIQYATEAASALIGAGCGLPIGEHLRSRPESRS